MTDNVIDVRFKQPTPIEQLLEDTQTFEFDELMIVGVKNGEVYLGTTELQSRAAGIGYLEIAKVELMRDYDE